MEHNAAGRIARAHCRSISGEVHSGFANLRSALPMNLKVRHHRFPMFSSARPDIERIETIRQECLTNVIAAWAPMRVWQVGTEAKARDFEKLEAEF